MSMSMHVVGFRPADERWRKMRHIYLSCLEMKVAVPEEVETFFNWVAPSADDSGVRIEIEKLACTSVYKEDMRQGFEIDLKKLPEGVTVVRFYNSY